MTDRLSSASFPLFCKSRAVVQAVRVFPPPWGQAGGEGPPSRDPQGQQGGFSCCLRAAQPFTLDPGLLRLVANSLFKGLSSAPQGDLFLMATVGREHLEEGLPTVPLRTEKEPLDWAPGGAKSLASGFSEVGGIDGAAAE